MEGFRMLAVQAAAAQAAALCFFGFHTLHEASAATACKYVFCQFGPEIQLGKEQSQFLWFSFGLLVFLEWFLAGKTGVLVFVDNFSQFGEGKEKGSHLQRCLPIMMTFRLRPWWILVISSRLRCMIPWQESGSVTKTPSGVSENSEVVHNGSGNHRKTFRVSGRARCVGRNGCGQRKLGAFRCGFPPQRSSATNPTFRSNGCQHKISGQHAPPAG